MTPEPVTFAPYPDRGPGISYEPSGRWVRATIGDTAIVDSRHPMLVWEPGRPVPGYAFPDRDVRTDLLTEASPPVQAKPGVARWYDVALGGARFEQLAWRYDAGPLAGHLAFEWFGRRGPGIEHWYEEDEEIYVHPRDPHTRVDTIASSRHVVVSLDGRMLADSVRPVLLFETDLPIRYYLPREDVDLGALAPSTHTSRCPYKGLATYWSLDGRDLVWTYEAPVTAASAITDLACFYNEAVDITVDGEALQRPVTHFS